MVPAILALLPSPSTLLPMLAETEEARQALQGQTMETAFAIGVGVACGSIVVTTFVRHRDRVVVQLMAVVSDGFSTYVARPAKRLARRWRRTGAGTEPAHPNTRRRS